MKNDGKSSGDSKKKWLNRTIDECIAERHPQCNKERNKFRNQMNIVRVVVA